MCLLYSLLSIPTELQLPKKLQSRDGSLAKFEKMFKQTDTDKDRRVTLMEFRNYIAGLESPVRTEMNLNSEWLDSG